MIFKQSNLIIALSIGLQIQSGNVNAFGLSDVTNAVDQVNSVAKQLNVPQPIPTSPTPTATASTITEIPNEFQGKWVTNQNNCVGNPDSGVVDIEKNRFYGYEWSSDIKSTKSLGKKLEVVFTTSADGEESPEASKQTWELNSAENALSISDAAGGVEKYSRCGTVVPSNVVGVPDSAVNKGKILFYCKAAKGKEIRLVNTGNGIEYSFGLANQKPDILVSVPYEKVLYASLGGAQSTDYQVSIPNGKTFYVVYSYEYARGCGKCKSDFGLGVVVSKESKKIADVECDRKAKLEPTSNTLIYDKLDNLSDVSDLLQSVTEEDSNFKSRGFFTIVQ